jgi:hypothetical protein
MNLQENIERIHEIMGVINEDNRPNIIKKMVDELGITTVIKMVGDYHIIEPYLNKEDKINFIKEIVMMWMKVSHQPGISILEVIDEPIDCGSDEEFIRQTQLLTKDGAFVDVFINKPLGMGLDSLIVPYEELPEDTLDKVYETTIKFMNFYNILQN